MLYQRVITAVILIPLVILGIFYLPALAFLLITGVILSIAMIEWSSLSGFNRLFEYCLIVPALWLIFFIMYLLPVKILLFATTIFWFYALYLIIRYPHLPEILSNKWLRLALGFIILSPCWVALGALQALSPIFILLLLLIVWIADTGAYFGGRKYGRHKLASRVSPKKTLEGLVAGLLAVFVLAILIGLIERMQFTYILLLGLVAIVVALFSVIGDLFESMQKREANVKDSGQWLPGHGGILDRIDSLTAAAPIFALLVVLTF